MITLYKYLGILLIPLIKINLILRVANGKENKKRFFERYGITSFKRPAGDLIWIHAASVGEFKSADLLINKFHKNYIILVTTTTLSAANYAMKHYDKKIIHQFAPLDISIWVQKFLFKWRPKLVIWIESDLWPMTMNLLKQNSIKALLVNVRISPNSFNRWKKIKFFYQRMTECFYDIYAQSELDKERIKQLTNRDIKFIGNLKLSSNFQYERMNSNNILKNLKNNKILMLASTHSNEEFQFLPVIKKLLYQYVDLKVIIAPRHPERANSILSLYIKNNISTKIINNENNFKEDVFIIDTFGDLSKYFNISDIVFLGGSLVNKGGHNPIEPAMNNCVIISGPNVYNWQNIYDDMLKNNACYVLNEILKLEKNLMDLFDNDKKINKLKEKSKELASKKIFNSEKLINSIESLIEVNHC